MSEKDLSVLGPLAEHRILIAPQIALILGDSDSAAAGRMRRLRDAGLVGYRSVFTGAPSVAMITGDGLKAIGSSGPAPKFDARAYRHDVGVAWLSLAARAGAFGRLDALITEQTMMSADRAAGGVKAIDGTHTGAEAIDGAAGGAEAIDGHEPYGLGLEILGPHGNPQRHYPDLLLTTHTGHRVALELELTAKSRQRMDRIMTAYASDARIDRVVYLVPDAALGRRVSDAARRAGIQEIVKVQRLAPNAIQGADDVSSLAPVQSARAAPVRRRAPKARAPAAEVQR